jgi:uncharacterized protein with HEPN domain
LKDDAVYLRHIIECIRRIEENTSEGVDAFRASHTRQDAVIRNLQVLTESCRRLSDDLKANWPRIDWRRISAFRNVVVHDYLGLDLELIWDITQRDIPELKGTVGEMLDANS